MSSITRLLNRWGGQAANEYFRMWECFAKWRASFTGVPSNLVGLGPVDYYVCIVTITKSETLSRLPQLRSGIGTYQIRRTK